MGQTKNTKENWTLIFIRKTKAIALKKKTRKRILFFLVTLCLCIVLITTSCDIPLNNFPTQDALNFHTFGPNNHAIGTTPLIVVEKIQSPPRNALLWKSTSRKQGIEPNNRVGLSSFYQYKDGSQAISIDGAKVVVDTGTLFDLLSSGISNSKGRDKALVVAFSLTITGSGGVIIPNPEDLTQALWIRDEFFPQSHTTRGNSNRADGIFCQEKSETSIEDGCSDERSPKDRSRLLKDACYPEAIYEVVVENKKTYNTRVTVTVLCVNYISAGESARRNTLSITSIGLDGSNLFILGFLSNLRAYTNLPLENGVNPSLAKDRAIENATPLPEINQFRLEFQ